MRKLYLSLTFAFATCFCLAQTVRVTATAATIGPTSYSTLKAAFDAINAGTHKGIIDIAINGDITETATATLNASGGTSAYTAISIQPTGGIVNRVTGDVAGPLVQFAGASNVTVDGLNTGSNSLFITNTNTGSTASTITFATDASNNTIQNTSLRSAGSAATTGTIVFAEGTVTGNDNNTITNCDLSDANGNFPTNAIYSLGLTTSGSENSNNNITNNTISNFFNAAASTSAIAILGGNTNWVINNNRFFQTYIRTYSAAVTHRIIQVTSGNQYTITGNTIGYATAVGTGTYTMTGAVKTAFIGIDLAVGTTIASSVQGNTVTAINYTSSNNSVLFTGINITSGNVNVGTTTGNTIGSLSGFGSITLTPTVGSNNTIGINSSGSGIVVIKNNKIGGIDLLPAGVNSGTLIGIQSTGTTAGTITISDNTIGNATENNMRVGTIGTTTGSGIARGIINSNVGTIIITGNIIQNFTHNSSSSLGLFRGIENQQGTATISSNDISYITNNGTGTSVTTPQGVGILLNYPTLNTLGVTVNKNRIHHLTNLNNTASGTVVMGLYMNNTNGAMVTQNTIYSLTNASTSVSTTAPSAVAGIYCRDAALADPTIIANNMISLGAAQSSNTAFIGIWNHMNTAKNYTSNIYYNTVNIQGTASSGATPSFCYYRGDFTNAISAPTLDIRNNLFNNIRNGGTGKHYAIANNYGNVASTATGWASNASNYNVLNANAATVGYWSGDQDFAGWKSQSSSDANSLNAITISFINITNDLHLVTAANIDLKGMGTPLASIMTDFDDETRNSTTPDIGADEISTAVVAITMEYFNGTKQGGSHQLTWKAGCSGTSVLFDIERSADGRTFKSTGTIKATQSRCAMPFNFADNIPLIGINYYRLKITEPDGEITYSRTIAIFNKEKGFEIVGLYPTLITQGQAVLSVSSAQPLKINMVITDMSGKMVQQQTVGLFSGSNMIQFNTQQLASGTYFLTGFTAEGKTRSIRFVKQ